MLRLIVTLAVGFAMLIGVGAWFDPEGARQAIRRDLAGIARHASRQASGVVREAVEQVGSTAAKPPPAASQPASRIEAGTATPSRPQTDPQAGPRTGKKRPPVIAQAPARGAEPPPAHGEEVEVVEIARPAEFVEAPLPARQEVAVVTSPGAASAASGSAAAPASPGARALESAPSDVGEQGALIRRMLAVYERVSQRR